MRVGSLFSGIGGIDLGLMRAGMTIAWQVEIDPWCRKVLAKHFPEAKRYADIRDCGAYNLDPVDLIAGGFPCQDVSNAGTRLGIDGERSGLWSEMWRVIGELRPRYVFVENVAALLGRGMGRVIGNLAAIGYDAEWAVISAADVGAPHLRERVWIVAYPNGDGCANQILDATAVACGHQSADRLSGENGSLVDTGHKGIHRRRSDSEAGAYAQQSSRATRHDLSRKRELPQEILANCELAGLEGHAWNDEDTEGWKESQGSVGEARVLRGRDYRKNWNPEPNVGRVAHGIPSRVDRIKGLGNAAIPQIPEMIGRKILRLEAQL